DTHDRQLYCHCSRFEQRYRNRFSRSLRFGSVNLGNQILLHQNAVIEPIKMPSKLFPSSPMKKLLPSLLAACAFALVSIALATTVIPPTFDDLVTRAEMIFQGTVTDVRSEWTGEGGQRHIASYVTFKVDDSIKGNPGAKVTLNLLGGTVGAETMEVSDAPKFKVG